MNEIYAKIAAQDSPVYKDDVLQLLGLAVLADKRILSHEITAFANAAIDIEAKLGMVTTFTRTNVFSWFEQNQKRLKSMLSHENFAPELHSLLERLSVTPTKSVLFDALIKISKSDGEFHISEHALIVLISQYWANSHKGVNHPGFEAA